MPIESASQIEIPNIDLWQLIFENPKREFPDDQVLYTDADTNRSVTFAQTRAAALQFGKGLQGKWQWQKNDVLAIFAPNNVETPAVIWACHWSGGIVTPANPASRAEELAFQLQDAGAKALVTHLSCLPVARAAAKLVGLPESRVVLLGEERDPERKIKHFSMVRDIMGLTEYSRPSVDPRRDLAFLAYSSGTTGLPKGVMLTHTNIVANVLQMAACVNLELRWDGGPDGKGDRIVSFLPFFHIYGLTVLIHEYSYRGVPLIVMPRFDLPRFLTLVQQHRASFAYIVPPVALLLSKHPLVAKFDLSSLRGLTSAAAPLTKELIDGVAARLPTVPLGQAYGLSETSPGVTYQVGKDGQAFPGSVGRLLPNVSARVVRLREQQGEKEEEEDVDVPPGTEGELLFRGPNIFAGYLNNPSGTAAVMTSDGYFRTGDVGYVDTQGNFYITDRVKELIKYKGFQVAPAQLEGLLLAHPQVDDVAVVGVYDESQATELPRAYVVLSAAGREGVKKGGGEQEEKTANEIAEWLAGKVAGYKRLRGGVKFVDAIPKSATGKILRRVLRDQAAEEQRKGERRGAKL